MNNILTDYYNTKYLSNCKEGDSSRVDIWTPFIKPIPINKKILDIGCGPGVHILSLLKSNEVHGIDIIDDYIESAKSNGYISQKCDVEKENLPFDNEYFDLVICTDVFEHLFNPLNLGKEIDRVTKPTGMLFASVPNHFYMKQCLNMAKGKGIILEWDNHQVFRDWNYFHIRFFTSRSFEEFIEQIGFSIINRFYDKFLADMPHIMKGVFPWRFQNFLYNFSRKRFFYKYPDLFATDFPILSNKAKNIE